MLFEAHSAVWNGGNCLKISIIQSHSTELNNFDILQPKSDEVCGFHFVAWFMTARGKLLWNDSQWIDDWCRAELITSVYRFYDKILKDIQAAWNCYSKSNRRSSAESLNLKNVFMETQLKRKGIDLLKDCMYKTCTNVIVSANYFELNICFLK